MTISDLPLAGPVDSTALSGFTPTPPTGLPGVRRFWPGLPTIIFVSSLCRRRSGGLSVLPSPNRRSLWVTNPVPPHRFRVFPRLVSRWFRLRRCRMFQSLRAAKRRPPPLDCPAAFQPAMPSPPPALASSMKASGSCIPTSQPPRSAPRRPRWRPLRFQRRKQNLPPCRRRFCHPSTEDSIITGRPERAPALPGTAIHSLTLGQYLPFRLSSKAPRPPLHRAKRGCSALSVDRPCPQFHS